MYFLLLERALGIAVVDVVEVAVWKGDFVDVCSRLPCDSVTPIDGWGVLKATKFWFVFDVLLDEWSCDTLFGGWEAGWKYVCIEGVP